MEDDLIGFNPEIHEKVSGGFQIKRSKKVIKIISIGAFDSRFTLVEKVLLEDAAKDDSEVKVILKSFDRSKYINVDDVELQWGLALFVEKGLLAPEKLSIILRDGESHESI